MISDFDKNITLKYLFTIKKPFNILENTHMCVYNATVNVIAPMLFFCSSQIITDFSRVLHLSINFISDASPETSSVIQRETDTNESFSKCIQT